ncbi:hypothetical protein MED121_04268 [Marinomonas sp. MED121]|uniref:hypothetical protein n=1 Tax=Marinomonas sp. MED121 TaxID=314277 RepID=UPI000068FAAA|nr:hypothetical protein [Marinomonas sp. MED121]EAQ63957.1 hypothetical protein MED121_04268 [Marinomonas sp. MED121]
MRLYQQFLCFKKRSKVLTVGFAVATAGLLTACSDDATLEVTKADAQASSQTSINQVESKQAYVLADYQLPSAIGADQAEQEALLKLLNEKESSKQGLTQEEIKQQLLLRLTLFSSDKNQTLAKLEAITQGLTRASELSAEQGKQDYELMAAMGSALSYQSIFYQADLGQMNLLSRKGMRYMDRAVKKAPNHLGVRLLRGLSYANMPAFLNRASFAVEDLSLLKNVLLRGQGERQGQDSKLATESAKKSSFKKQDKLFIEFIDYYLALSFYKNAQLESAKSLWQALSNTAEGADSASDSTSGPVSQSKWSALATKRLEEV